jgi:hypothetical protein
MPNRGQTQGPGKQRRNPGTYTPDDDETVENQDTQRQAQEQQGRKAGRQPDPSTEKPGIEDEEAEEDEDEKDGLGPRP